MLLDASVVARLKIAIAAAIHHPRACAVSDGPIGPSTTCEPPRRASLSTKAPASHLQLRDAAAQRKHTAGEMPLYGAVVVGPPGAGKSTFCAGLCRYLSLAERPCALVNLDPACEGEGLTKFAIDVRDFVSVDAVMKDQKLGPNGALRYCLEQLWKSNWLKDRIDAHEVPHVNGELR